MLKLKVHSSINPNLFAWCAPAQHIFLHWLTFWFHNKTHLPLTELCLDYSNKTFTYLLSLEWSLICVTMCSYFGDIHNYDITRYLDKYNVNSILYNFLSVKPVIICNISKSLWNMFDIIRKRILMDWQLILPPIHFLQSVKKTKSRSSSNVCVWFILLATLEPIN